MLASSLRNPNYREIGRRSSGTVPVECRRSRLKVAGPIVGHRTLSVDRTRLHGTVLLGAGRLHFRDLLARFGARLRSHFLCLRCLALLPAAPRLKPALVGLVARTIAGTDLRTDGLQAGIGTLG